MKFAIYQESRIGKRKSNQDRLAYAYTREALLLVVADGMGGHLRGDVAAQIATQRIVESFKREARPTLAAPAQFLAQAMAHAHESIAAYASDQRLPDSPRTTCVACVVQNGVASWTHAGDSRLYLIRNGCILVRTIDHSYVQMLLDKGLIDQETAATHPARNRVLSCLGGPHLPHIDFSPDTPLCDGDVMVLCSDGAWSPFTSEEMAQLFLGSDTRIRLSVPRFLDQAELRSGEYCDNLSVVAMQWQDGDARQYLDGDSIGTQAMPPDGCVIQADSPGAESVIK